MGHGGVSQVTYTWGNLLDLVRQAKRHKDLEVRSALLADICNAVDELDKDKEAMVEQAFSCDGYQCGTWEQCNADVPCVPKETACKCVGLVHRDSCPEWTLPL